MTARRLKLFFFAILASLLITACGGDSGGGGSPTTTVTVTATPASLATGATSTVTASVNLSGTPVADGTTVNFSLSSSAYGTLSAASATTTGGNASVTFTASSTAGTVTVTATSSGGSGVASITVGSSGGGGIEYISATPQVIGLQGSGQTTTSAIVFKITDETGSPVGSTTVSFTLNGPSGGNLPSAGGEYIGANDGTPTTAAGTSDSDGLVSVILNSGSVAGPATIAASVTVGSTTYSASSSVVSIGGGIPSAAHFTLATSVRNLPGLAVVDAESTISAYLADRFGNFNVLEGTSISFYTEAGAIDRAGVVDSVGKTSVIFRTQNPMPIDVTANATEIANLNAYDSIFTTNYAAGTVNPRDGWATVLATVQGEESFVDANANGIYDTGEFFSDLGEPFIDRDDDGSWTLGEIYIDENGSGTYTAGNGVWDGPGCPDAGCRTSKMLFINTTLMFTGNLQCVISPVTINVPDGGSQTFDISVHDQNLNIPLAGTTITVTATAGDLLVPTLQPVADGVSDGPTIFQVTLSDNVAGSPEPVQLTVIATTSSVVGCVLDILGTIN